MAYQKSKNTKKVVEAVKRKKLNQLSIAGIGQRIGAHVATKTYHRNIINDW